MAKEQKTNLYLLAILGIVAIVGIVVLILNSGTGGMSYSSDDLSGEEVEISENLIGQAYYRGSSVARRDLDSIEECHECNRPPFNICCT